MPTPEWNRRRRQEEEAQYADFVEYDHAAATDTQEAMWAAADDTDTDDNSDYELSEIRNRAGPPMQKPASTAERFRVSPTTILVYRYL